MIVTHPEVKALLQALAAIPIADDELEARLSEIVPQLVTPAEAMTAWRAALGEGQTVADAWVDTIRAAATEGA